MINPESLKKSHLCRGLDETELAALAAIASPHTVNAGEILFWQGDAVTGVFVLLEGCVRIYKSSPEGKEYTLHYIHPGQMFAEATLFRDDGYPANCAAVEVSVVAHFPKSGFVDFLQKSPSASLKMIASLSAFVRDLNQQVEDLSLREVSGRLSAYLLNLSKTSNSDRFELDLSKSELARKLGTISETLSRNLRKLKDMQVISEDGKAIVLLDKAHLEEIAAGKKI
jgi:CRP/FNR family transcriptional regulator